MAICTFSLRGIHYGDDIYIIGNHTIEKNQWIRVEIKGRFEMKSMGLLNHYL
jgi:hypothetical protein